VHRATSKGIPAARARLICVTTTVCSTPTRFSVISAHFLDTDDNPVVVPVSGSLVSTSIAALRGARR